MVSRLSALILDIICWHSFVCKATDKIRFNSPFVIVITVGEILYDNAAHDVLVVVLGFAFLLVLLFLFVGYTLLRLFQCLQFIFVVVDRF